MIEFIFILNIIAIVFLASYFSTIKRALESDLDHYKNIISIKDEQISVYKRMLNHE